MTEFDLSLYTLQNGFKCHMMSESHQRQLLLFAENPDKYIDDFSKYVHYQNFVMKENDIFSFLMTTNKSNFYFDERISKPLTIAKLVEN